MAIYVTKRCIFEGDWSQVFLATDTRRGKDVVLKQLRELYPGPESMARFAREFEITRGAAGPQVIEAYEMHAYEGTVGLILEDFGGRSVADLTQRQGPFDPIDALPLAIQVADGLAHIHRRNIVHRDINPANIVWNTQTGQVKLIDFGISQVLSRTTASHCRSRRFSGTPPYMSPEQTGRMNRDVDCRSDLYSLGVTLYELLTGRRPFESEDPLELVHSHIARSPVPPCEYGVDKQLSDVIMILLAKRAEDRYNGATGLRHDLVACLEALKAGRTASFPLRGRDSDERLLIPQKLYGRQAEQARLLEAFNRTAEGQVGVLMVAGYSGVGKTSLVHEVHAPLTARRGLFVEGKFDQLNRGTPYDSLIQAFRGLVREILTASEGEISDWREAILAAVGHHGRILVDVIPEIEHILGPQPEAEVLGPAEARNRFQLVMARFLKALGSAEHPLVLFLDDLQWADLPTLELIRHLATDPDTSHVLFIGAYRDNEVSPSHPLMTTLAGMHDDGAEVETIELGPLGEEDVLQLLGDTLHQAPGHLRLAIVCHAKTRGNAFFLNRFLESLHHRRLLGYDGARQCWTWDLEAIQAEAVTDNVVDFMAAAICELEPEARRSLQVAACIGNTFELSTLARTLQTSRKDSLARLRPALEAALVQPADESFWYVEEFQEESTDFHYRFAHDRIQQAAYGMLEEGEAASIHLGIGRILADRLEELERGPELFVVVEHLNRAAALIRDPGERERLAHLNLRAARRASLSAAFEPAHEYFLQAHRLLGAQAWTTDYPVALAVHLEGARAAYLSGHYDVMDERIEAVLARGRALLDRVRAREVRIQALVSQEKLTQAVALALEVLEELGIRLERDPRPEDVQAAVSATLALLEGKDAQTMRSLPEASDPEVIAAQRIQAGLMSSAYLAVPNLLPLLCCSMVETTLERGVCQPAIYGFSCLGLVLITARQVDRAYQIGKIAWEMTDRYEDRSIKVKNLHVVGSLINSHVEPLRATLESNREVCRLGLDTGDIEYAAWALHTEVCNGFWAGLELDRLAETARHHVALLEHHKQLPALACTYQFVQAIENMRGNSQDPARLVSERYDENAHRDRLLAKNFRGALFVLSAVATMCRYIFGALQEALTGADESAAYVDGAASTYHIVIWHQYRALAALRLSGRESDQVRETLASIQPNRELLETLLPFSPVNFEHRVRLIDAEVARLEGRLGPALALYEQAIEAARQNEFTHEQALANELAGRFLLDTVGKTPARGYILEAIFGYALWGATAKVARLEEEFAELLAGFRQVRTLRTVGRLGAPTSLESSTGTVDSSQLDLSAAIRASQAISGEIVLVDLVQTLMRLALEVGGGQRGLLLLDREGRWEVACEGIVGRELELHSMERPLETYIQCPEKIIKYVRRTREHVLLADASQSELFRDDDYIKRRATRSLLCLPVKRHNQLKAILYLENDLATGAFTHQHLDLLRVLVGQAAISIENAHFYNTLERRVEERTLELRAEIKERIRVQEELRILATTDSLTGTANRRRFFELAEQEFKRSRRYPAPLSAMMLDADRFKSINDLHGHDVGDLVLKSLSRAVAAELRSTEIFGRLGGEEFAVALPETAIEGAAVVAERILRSVSELEVEVGGVRLSFTVSIGLAQVRAEDDCFDDALKRADQALYQAKAAGRNQVVAWRSDGQA
jgi:diguanylate cyclase (GGDEF)-like protein